MTRPSRSLPFGFVAVLLAACTSGPTPAPAPASAVIQLPDNVTVGPDDVYRPPEPTYRIACPYPPELRPSALRGRVIAKAVITKEGLPTQIEILETNHELFANSVVATLPRWRFKPATLNGAPVAAYFVVTVSFRVG